MCVQPFRLHRSSDLSVDVAFLAGCCNLKSAMNLGTAVCVCGHMLVVCLLSSRGQELKKGLSCEGEKRDLCKSGTVCEDGICRLELGGNKCRSSFNNLCKHGLFCDWTSEVCVIAHGGDCSNTTSLCPTGYSCDSMFRCQRSVGTWCSSGAECVAGAQCTVGRCTCTAAVSKKSGAICEPLEGRVGGACDRGHTCSDPNATCNTTSLLCHCQPGYTVSSGSLSCMVKAGQSCSGDKQSLCEPGSNCNETQQVCKVTVGSSCAGDKRDHCQTGYCVEGTCRAEFGTECQDLPYASCRPEGYCMYSYQDGSFKCRLEEGQMCQNYTALCMRGLLCDPVTYTCKRVLDPGYDNCWEDDQCPAGARCRGRRCKCTYNVGTFAPKDRICGVPQGKVGGECHTKVNRTACDDAHATCNTTTRLCQCRTGYVTNLNRAKCVLDGPKCSLYHDYPNAGSVTSFFRENLRVHLPCRFKMANFHCGAGSIVEIFANRTYRSDIADTFTSGITVNIYIRTGSRKIRQTYTITLEKIETYMQRNVTKDNPWQTTCRPAPCADDRVKLSVQAKTGRAVLKRGLLKVTYEPAKVRTTRSGRKHVVKSWGRVDIECGHPKMESVESYPQVLCGSPENTAADVSSFRKRIEVELKKDLPDTFGYIPQWAFDSARLSDHAVLRRQSVPQQDSLCQEASDIVSGTCPAVAEKMYNCSNMYDPHQFDFSSYVTCVDDVMHPMKLYVSCLRALCERCEDSLHDTCTTLRTASQLCDPRMGLAGVGVRDPRVMLAADLVVRAKCPQVKP